MGQRREGIFFVLFRERERRTSESKAGQSRVFCNEESDGEEKVSQVRGVHVIGKAAGRGEMMNVERRVRGINFPDDPKLSFALVFFLGVCAVVCSATRPSATLG